MRAPAATAVSPLWCAQLQRDLYTLGERAAWDSPQRIAQLRIPAAAWRERMRVAGEMRIRTAQARITGWALCLLPFVMFIGMNLLHPGYGRVLFENPLGRKMVTYAAILMAIGMFLIRRIIRVNI